MNKFIQFLKSMLTSHSGISSKRVCGFLGFIAVMFVLIYCTIHAVQAPIMIDTFMYIICMLLGIDSVTSIWKYPNNKGDKQNC